MGGLIDLLRVGEAKINQVVTQSLARRRASHLFLVVFSTSAADKNEYETELQPHVAPRQ